MNQPIPDSLLTATAEFLQKHPPFDEMERDVLRFLAGRLRLSYHAKDNVILSPEVGEPASFYIVQRGTVRVLRRSPYQSGDGGSVTLRSGESFSVGALLEKRPVSHPYIAAEDTFCYRLAAQDFHELVQRSLRFHAFCTRYVTSLLQQSRRELQRQYGSITSEQQTMNTALRTVIKRTPVSCGADTPVAQVLQVMKTQKIGAMVIVSPTQAPIGIFTSSDVLDRVALAGLDLDQPISRVMTPNPVTLPAEASVYDAAFTMARSGCRHVLVVNESRLIGVVTERDLFALQRISMRQINRSIAGASGLAQLQQVSRDMRSLGGNMLGQGVFRRAVDADHFRPQRRPDSAHHRAGKNLDDWLAALDIHNYARHNAVADARSTAQLLLVMLGACAGKQVTTLADLTATERGQRWLERR